MAKDRGFLVTIGSVSLLAFCINCETVEVQRDQGQEGVSPIEGASGLAKEEAQAEGSFRIRQRKGHGKAVGAVGRHLAEAAYWILRKKEPYRDPGLRALGARGA